MAQIKSPEQLGNSTNTWSWSRIEGVLIKVTPEGRVLFKNIATGKVTGDKKVLVDGTDIYKTGVSGSPPQLPQGPRGRLNAQFDSSYMNWRRKFVPAIEKAIDFYRESPEGKKATSLAEDIKTKGLIKSDKVGVYEKEGVEGDYVLNEKGDINFLGGTNKQTGQEIVPSISKKGSNEFTPQGGRGGRNFRLLPPSEKQKIIAASDEASGIPEGETIKSSGVSSFKDLSKRKSANTDMQINENKVLPKRGTRAFRLLPQEQREAIIAEDDAKAKEASANIQSNTDLGVINESDAGFVGPPKAAMSKTIKDTVAAKKQPPSGGGAATGSGSKAGLGYLRSREDMMARDKSVKAAMADEKKERRQMAEDRFAMRKGDILARQAERAKMEQEKREANEIKSEAGNLLGRVIRDSSGKVVGTSTTKAGRKALGDDYKGAGGTFDFSKPAGSFEELEMRDAVNDRMGSRQKQVMDLMNKRASAPLEEAKKREQPFKEGLALNPSIVDAMQKPPSASDQTPLNVPTLNLNPPPERGSREFRNQSVGDRRSQIASADVVGSNITPSTDLNLTQDIPRESRMQNMGVTNTPPPVTQESSKIQAEKRKEALEKAKREREQRKLLEQTQQADKYSRTA